MNYAITASILAVIVAAAYLYHVYSALEVSIRESHGAQEEDADWQHEASIDYRVLSSIAGSTLLIFLLSAAPVFWWLVPFSGIAAAVGIIVAFRLERRPEAARVD